MLLWSAEHREPTESIPLLDLQRNVSQWKNDGTWGVHRWDMPVNTANMYLAWAIVLTGISWVGCAPWSPMGKGIYFGICGSVGMLPSQVALADAICWSLVLLGFFCYCSCYYYDCYCYSYYDIVIAPAVRTVIIFVGVVLLGFWGEFEFDLLLLQILLQHDVMIQMLQRLPCVAGGIISFPFQRADPLLWI